MEKTRAEILGENLERIRKAQGYSRKTLADVVGVTEIAFGAYERGIRQPPIDKIFTLADFLEVCLTDITGESATTTDERFFKNRFFRAHQLITLAGYRLNPLADDSFELDVYPRSFWQNHGEAEYVPTLQIKNDRDFVAIIEYVEETAIRDNQTFDSIMRKFVGDIGTIRHQRQQRYLKTIAPYIRKADDGTETKEEFLREVTHQHEDYQKRLAEFVKNGGKIQDDLSDEDREIMESHIKRGEKLLDAEKATNRSDCDETKI